MKILLVQWLDACSDNSWISLDRVSDHTELTTTVGFFVKETKDVLILAHTYDEETKHVNGLMHIPVAMIKGARKVLWQSKTKNQLRSK